MQQVPFYFIVVVWGDAYVDMLLQASLRCFLSPNNIPGLSNLKSSRFIFVTTKEDYLRISNTPIFNLLKSYVEPAFVELEAPVADDNVYTRATRGYELATELACKNKACAVYLLPDCLISNGTLSRLENYLQQGRDVVMLPGPRVIKEKVIEYLDDMCLTADAVLSFEPRQLVSLGMTFFHRQFKHYDYAGKSFTKWPHMVTWDIPNQRGILIRAFHLHPLMVNYSNRTESVDFNKFDTIDGSFIKKNFLDLNRFLLETDSDNMILYSMTEADDRVEDGLLWGKDERLKAILEMAQNGLLVNELQKIYFYNAYKLHVDELNESWSKVERESLLVVKEVLLSTNVTNKATSFYLVARQRILDVFPYQLRACLKRIYWKMRGMLSWFRAKITVI